MIDVELYKRKMELSKTRKMAVERGEKLLFPLTGGQATRQYQESYSVTLPGLGGNKVKTSKDFNFIREVSLFPLAEKERMGKNLLLSDGICFPSDG